MSALPAGKHLGWLFPTIAVLAFVAWDTAVCLRHYEAVSALRGAQVATPTPDPRSPTGFAQGLRPLILPHLSWDTYHWIMQTQETLASGTERLRSVAYDNAPLGREVHWAMPERLWLALLAQARSEVSGQSTGASVEWAALVANPILLAVLILAWIPGVAVRFGSRPAVLLVLVLIASYPLFLDFLPGNAGHHAAAAACLLIMVSCLLEGTGRLPQDRARPWFVASGAAGGVALWISASSAAPVLAGTGLGALVFTWTSRRGSDDFESAEPKNWRLWGISGCVTSLAAYLLEYAPSHFGWRLEVNHPLYALAWLGGAELVCQCGQPLRWRENAIRWILPILLLVPLPGAILVASPNVFWVADPFVWRLHADYILEFNSAASYLAGRPFDLAAVGRLAPLLLVLPTLGLALRPSTPPRWRSRLLLGLIPALFECGLAAVQIRWWGLASGLAAVSILPLFDARERPAQFPQFQRLAFVGCLCLLVPGLVSACRSTAAASEFTMDDITGLAERDLADWLVLHSSSPVLSTPTLTTSLIYHGSVAGIGTLYWENKEGLEAAAQIFGATSTEAAHSLIQARHIRTIVLASWDPFWAPYVLLAHGLRATDPVPRGTFAGTLLGAGPLPPWLTPIAYSLPAHPALRNQRVWIYEVVN